MNIKYRVKESWLLRIKVILGYIVRGDICIGQYIHLDKSHVKGFESGSPGLAHVCI